MIPFFKSCKQCSSSPVGISAAVVLVDLANIPENIIASAYESLPTTVQIKLLAILLDSGTHSTYNKFKLGRINNEF